MSQAESTKPIWAAELHPFGLNYYTSIVDNAEELVENHKLATRSCFGTRSSSVKKLFVSEPENIENDDPNCPKAPNTQLKV